MGNTMNIRIGFVALVVLIAGLSSAASAQNQAQEMRRIFEEKLGTRPEELKKLYETTELRRQSDGALLTGEEKFRAFAEMLRKNAEAPSDGTPKIAVTTETDERLVSGDLVAESEVHAAINPKDSNNIVISPIRNGTSAVLNCPIYYTKDFGKTWRKSSFDTQPLDPAAVILGGGDPMFVFNADGKAYFSWIHLYSLGSFDSVNVGMFWASSTDGGETWQRPAENWIGKARFPFAALFSGVNLDFFDKQWFACDRTNSQYRGNVYAGIYHVSPSDSRMGIRVLTPTAGNFTQTTVRVPGNYHFNQFASMDVDNAGNAHLTFFASLKSDTTRNFMFHSISTDGGKTLQQPVKIAEVQTFRLSPAQANETMVGVSASRFMPSPQFAIDKSSGATSGNLYATWTADGVSSRVSKDLDIYFSRSTDNGATWSNPITVNDDGKDNGRHQFYSSVAVSSEGVVVLMWYDRRNETFNAETELFMAYSFDGGKTFTKNIAVSNSPSNFNRIGAQNNNFGIGEYHQVLATKGYAIPVWADGRASNGNIDIYTAFIPISQSPQGVERISPVNPDFSAGEVYPNPADDNISCELSLLGESFVQFDITTPDGKALMTERRLRMAGEYKETLPLQSLAAGAYILKISTRFGSVVRKFSVVK